MSTKGLTLPPSKRRKLTPEQVAEIRRLGGRNRKGQGRKADHPTHLDLANEYAVAPSRIWEILTGRSYREVAGGR